MTTCDGDGGTDDDTHHTMLDLVLDMATLTGAQL
eukprot:CAMPEP_0171298672 /NCGR_PEP_ID=MMETSP0816-20121228/7464_1 /TAXON_ID=420281 /ORGANISM="Proboscia inermis, Strain CCAP1064/1" /LENGTH=33 /DNA_ID= /DNA_START= /DNA_END= /DNA_ORIENTATION=